jgi:hypothetical protein
LSFFVACSALFEYVPLVWHSEPAILILTVPSKYKYNFGERSFGESKKEQRWTQFDAKSAWYGPPLRTEWISLQQKHAALVALCEFEKDPPEIP